MRFNLSLITLSLVFCLYSCSDKPKTIDEIKVDAKHITTENNVEQIIKAPLLEQSNTKETNDVNSYVEITSDSTDIFHPNIPASQFQLPYNLKEISGLSFNPINGELLAVNDEQGKIFRLNPLSGKVTSVQDFYSNGDYEGIEVVGSEIYILKSNGNLYRTNTDQQKGSEVIRTELRSGNDAEGLGYDRITGSLLLACKGKPKISSDQDFKKTKVVYSFNIVEEVCSKEPFLNIADQVLEDYVIKNKKLFSGISGDLKSLRKRVKSFAPSAITQHPEKDEFYLLSSIGKLLIVVNRNSEILKLEFLDSKIHAQPEGCCFDDKGNFYIANEGKYGIAKIYKYRSTSL